MFAAKDDYHYCLDSLAEFKDLYHRRIYAFCLMTNYVHLVVDPGDDPESLGRLM